MSLIAEDMFDVNLDAHGPVYAAVEYVWGPRCPDFAEHCPCCKAWAEYDRLINSKPPATGAA